MADFSRWKKILAPDDRVKVNVQGRIANMTRTQAFRFDQLTRSWEAETIAEPDNPFERLRYSLQDAALETLQSEESVLHDAVVARRPLFVNAAGLIGRWRHAPQDGPAVYTGMITLDAGYLAVPAPACDQLVAGEPAIATVLELRIPTNPDALGFDEAELADLCRRGPGQRAFCLAEPLVVERCALTLMAPLNGDN